MAEAFLQVLLDNLSSLIRDEIGTIMGVDDEMKKLSSNLTAIQAVVEDAELKQVERKDIRDWLCKLNDLTYEIEDILDTCSTEFEKLQHKGEKSISQKLKSILYKFKIGRRMKEVTRKLDVVAQERSNFHLTTIVFEKQSKVAFTRETCSISNEPDHVYGRDADREKIVDVLVNQVTECQQLSVLPIVGMGGLGKTTLAQLVFNDHRVAEHFDVKFWVCVSDNFDLKTLIKAILESASESGNASNLEYLDTLQQRLRRLLNQKRYLIVLDDVWNEDQEKWSALKNILACGSSGASIILTTRLKIVADIVSTLPAHYLEGLSNEDCWKLFKQRALGQENELSMNLEAIGKQIVEKCAGVPLAAKTLGSLLRFKRKEKEWLNVKESEIWKLPQEETSILPALRLSYHHLPLNLRQCFAYCAVFPKDHRMVKEELIQLWIAHGYISSNQSIEVEDVGEEIWNELVLRSFFQEDRIYGTEIQFSMHDLVHDLAQSIMENKVPGAQAESKAERSCNDKVRYLNLGSRSAAFPKSFLPNIDLSSAINKFSHLRSLDACETNIDAVPPTIGNLNHLRFLNLSYTQIHTLPKTICSLWNLKILNLDDCYKLVRLPKHMRSMRNLRHLYLSSCDSLIEFPPYLGELSFLKTLSMFIVGHGRGNQLEELMRLNLGGELKIKHLERVESHLDAKKANLIGKQNLRFLTLEWEEEIPSKLGENEDDMVLEVLEPHPYLEKITISGFKGKNLSFWMENSVLKNILKIKIGKCPNIFRLPLALGELPRLEELHLENLALKYIVEDEVATGFNSTKQLFPSLRGLKLFDLPNLKGLLNEEMREVHMFPNCEVLSVKHCPSLILPQISSLEKLYLYSWHKLIFASISKCANLDHLLLNTDEQTTPVPVEGLVNLTKLKRLSIWGAHDLCLPEKELGVLKYLTDLNIRGNKTQMGGLPGGWLPHLITLKHLNIIDCPEFIELPEGMKYLLNLESITLSVLPKMIRIPEALRSLPSLRSLHLETLTQLASLPDWLGNLTNLNRLDIYNCKKLSSLPEMPSITYLYILECPELKRRYEKGKGEDWHKIEHIPHVYIL